MEVGLGDASQVSHAVDHHHRVRIFAALFPALLPISRLADLVNIGTLLAFAIVCAGVWVLRVRHPELHRPFKTPLVPLVPILGIVSALYLMSRLAAITWEVMIGWLIFGLIIYFTYSVKHSKVQKLARSGSATEPGEFMVNRNGLPRGRPFCSGGWIGPLYAVVLAQNSSKARTSSAAICCAVDCSMTKRCIR